MTRRPAFRAVLDGRYVQDHFPGIGRYTHSLGLALAAAAPPRASLTLLHDPASANTRFDLRAFHTRGVRLRAVGAPAMSPREQLSLPWAARRLRASVVHIPHCVKPLWLPCRSVV